jgi:hypothetical protein
VSVGIGGVDVDVDIWGGLGSERIEMLCILLISFKGLDYRGIAYLAGGGYTQRVILVVIVTCGALDIFTQTSA